MLKKTISTISGKNRIIANIIDALRTRRNFLILGHRNPDEDCIAAMTAFGLIVSKLSGNATLYLGTKVHEHFSYLLNICRYNSIEVIESPELPVDRFDTIVVLDTPKPSMLQLPDSAGPMLSDRSVLKIEVDHHIGGDGTYCGDEGYRLVTEASSASELVGHIALKINGNAELLEQLGITELFSRNISLAILSGIIGDSQMGKFLKSRKERRYYELFSTMFSELLARQTTKQSNFSSKEEVFSELQRLSAVEEECFDALMRCRRMLPACSYIVLEKPDMERLTSYCGLDAFVSVSRSVVNTLADESGRFGLIAYADPVQPSLYQFRFRRSARFKAYDLRNVLDQFGIEDGGGHEGAIGFRIPAGRLESLEGFVKTLIAGIEAELESV